MHGISGSTDTGHLPCHFNRAHSLFWRLDETQTQVHNALIDRVEVRRDLEQMLQLVALFPKLNLTSDVHAAGCNPDR